MDKNPFFSIIIPVYNVAPYLRECLDSLLAQTVSDWEAICINDASSDASGIILGEYAARDPRFRIVTQPRNGGVSVARNVGLDLVKGDYVGFVDPDDVISINWLEAVKDAFATHADMVKMSITRIRKFTSYVRPFHVQEFEGYDIFNYGILRGGITFQNFYRREVVRDVRFCVGMKVYEDAVFNLYALLNVTKAVKCEFDGYWYRDSVTSAWKRRCSDDIERLLKELISWYNNAYEVLRKNVAEVLAKERLSWYVTVIVHDFVCNAKIVDVRSAAPHLKIALGQMEKATGLDLASQIHKGRLTAIRRFAYLQLIRNGRWELLRLLLVSIRFLGSIRK